MKIVALGKELEMKKILAIPQSIIMLNFTKEEKAKISKKAKGHQVISQSIQEMNGIEYRIFLNQLAGNNGNFMFFANEKDQIPNEISSRCITIKRKD